MDKLIASSHRNPCPVCEKTNGNCRTQSDESLILCMTFHEDSGRSGFKYLHPSKDGLWGIHVRDDGRLGDSDKLKEYQEARERDRILREKTLRESLSESERDHSFRLIAKANGLNPEHRQDLERRGINPDLAEVMGFFSLSPNPIPDSVDERLPGVRWVGRVKYFGRGSGYFCPAFNAKGEIIGGQIRRDNPINGGKYQWLKSEQFSSHLDNGELPLTLIPNSESKDLYLTEGILKPLIASEKHKINCLGAAGGNFSASPNQFRENIKNYDRFIVAIDGGDIINPQRIRHWLGQYEFFKGERINPLVLWWGQTTKDHHDIDELESLQGANIIPFDDWLKIALSNADNGLKPFIGKVLMGIAKAIRLKDFTLPKPSVTFESKDRARAWLSSDKEAIIIDTSYCGDGKTHAVPSIENETGKIWYVTSSHRNPSIEKIADDFEDLTPRTQWGYYRDDQGKLREADKDTPRHLIEIQPNCHRADLFNSLANLGYNPNQKRESIQDGKTKELNPICGGCNKLKFCGISQGNYRKDRQESLQKARIRTDIHSMPRPDEYSYSKDIAIIDELTSLDPTKKITSSYQKLILELDRIRPLIGDEDHQFLDSLIQFMRGLFEGQQGYYGLTHEEIIKASEGFNPDESKLDRLINTLESMPLPIDTLIDSDGISYKALNKKDKDRFSGAIATANSILRRESKVELTKKIEEIPPNAIINILKALRKNKGVVLGINRDSLSITIDNRDEYKRIFNRCKKIIITDATATPEQVRLYLGTDRPIKFIKSKKDKPLKNLDIYQYTFEKGISSNDYSKYALERINNCIDEVSLRLGYRPKVIGTKAYKDDLNLSGWWGNHNRGSNDFLGEETLITVGIPYLHRGALSDEYLALNGSLDGLDKYYEDRVNSEIFQGAFRQRPDRFPDKRFTLIMITPENVDLSWMTEHGAKITRQDAAYLGPKCAGKGQRTLLESIKAIREKGLDSLRGVARELGKSHEAIAKVFRQSGLTIEKVKTCRKDLVSQETVNFSLMESTKEKLTPDPLVKLFEDLLNLDPVQLIELVQEYLNYLSWDDFVELFLSQWPKALQIKALSLIEGILIEDPPPMAMGRI